MNRRSFLRLGLFGGIGAAVVKAKKSSGTYVEPHVQVFDPPGDIHMAMGHLHGGK